MADKSSTILEADIAMDQDATKIGQQVAQMTYEGMAAHQSLRSTADFRNLVCGFAVRIGALTGANLAATYPDKDRDVERSLFLESIGQSILDCAQTMKVHSQAMADAKVRSAH